MWARSWTVRAPGAAALSVLLLLGSLLSLVGGAPGAPVAQAKKIEAKASPGQVKKLEQTPLPVAAPEPPSPADLTTKTTNKLGKAAKPEQAVTKPSKARNPKQVEQPRGRPSPPEPSVSVPAPASVAATPATTPLAPVPVQAEAPIEVGAAEPQPRASGERRRTARARSKRSTRAPASTATGPVGRSTSSGTTQASDVGSAAPEAADGSETSSDANDKRADSEPSSPVIRTVRDIVEVVPDSVKLALAGLAALSLLLAGGYAFSALRVRSLARQRGELLSDVGLLQSALLPPVPDRVGALETSVAYRPADGLGAGGDFYDVLPLSGGRAGFVLGDISGHGRDALERTAFLRYTLRAYLEAGLEPRLALQVAGRVIGDSLGGDFATVLLAVHDPKRGSLTYASAGHPAPIVVGGPAFEPVLAGSSPPIGAGMRTGLRQTTLPLTPGVVACLFTDGLIEARTDEGLLGRERLAGMLAELGDDATASALIERVAAETSTVSDDMAVCLLSPTATVTTGGFRTEQLELSEEEAGGPLPGRFLEECRVAREARDQAEHELRDVVERFGGAVLSVTFGSRRTVEVLPRNVESIEVASRQAVAG